MEPHDFYWLTGLLEGEGSFMHGPPSAPSQAKISIEMTDRDVVERVAQLFGVGYLHRPKRAATQHKQTYATCVRGRPAIILMKQLLPHMGSRRQARIREVLARYTERPVPAKAPLTPAEVEQIRQDPETNVSRLARQYSVSRTHIRRIKAGFTSSTAYVKAKQM